jgi:hypothetical protein
LQVVSAGPNVITNKPVEYSRQAGLGNYERHTCVRYPTSCSTLNTKGSR